MYSQCQAWENVQGQVVTGFDFIIIIIIFIKLVKRVTNFASDWLGL